MRTHLIHAFLLTGYILAWHSISVAEDSLDKVRADYFGKGERIPIAVLDLDAKGEGIDKGVGEALTEIVRYNFSKGERIDLVAREKMLELAKEKAIQLSGCTDVSCAVKIGKALNVQKLVTGSIVKLGKEFTLFLRVVDVEKEKVECSEKEEAGTKIDSLKLLVPLFVTKVAYCIWVQKARDDVRRNSKNAYSHAALAFALGDMSFIAMVYGDNMTSNLHRREQIEEIREAARLKPDDDELQGVLWAAIWNYSILDDKYKVILDEVEKEYREAIRSKPEDVFLLENLAGWLDSQGKRKEARQYWEMSFKVEKRPEWIEKIKKRLEEPD